MNYLLKDKKDYKNFINIYNKEIEQTKIKEQELLTEYRNIKEKNKQNYQKLLKEQEIKKKLKSIFYEKRRKKQKVINLIGIIILYSASVTAPISVTFIPRLSLEVLSSTKIISITTKTLAVIWSFLNISFSIPDIISTIKNKNYPIVIDIKLDKYYKKNKYKKQIEEIRRIENEEKQYKKSVEEEREYYNEYKKVHNKLNELENKKQKIENLATSYENFTNLDRMIVKSGMAIRKHKKYIKVKK